MARISNLNKAFMIIEDNAKNHQGALTTEVYKMFLDDAVKECNLDPVKVQTLKGMKFTLPMATEVHPEVKLKILEPIGAAGHEDKQCSDEKGTDVIEQEIQPPVDLVLVLCDKVENLELALAKIATLAGYSNYLREFGLKPWVPSKKDIGKNYG